jgi:hypothetical protein
MKRVSKTILASAVGLGLSLPSLAHVGSAAAPHVHAGDGGGLLVLALLTALAAWLGRRGR